MRNLTPAAALAVALLAACGGDETSARQQAVAEVMPFDLDRTTHRFEQVDDGVVQTVVADDTGDAVQVDLVRDHLRHEAERFRDGDFGDPSAIHGESMPGLAELRRHDGRIEVTYRDVDGGGRLTFRTDDDGLVDALHRWADAQVADHGAHAEHDG